MPQLIEHGRIIRPVIGIETLKDYQARRLGVKGVVVFSVQDGLAADAAGMVGLRYDNRGQLHLGDVVIAINDAPVTNEDSLLSYLAQFKPGDEVKVTTIRDEKIYNYEVTLTKPN